MKKKKPTIAEDKLFEHAPESVKKLHNQAREEKRQQERQDWWKNHNPERQ